MSIVRSVTGTQRGILSLSVLNKFLMFMVPYILEMYHCTMYHLMLFITFVIHRTTHTYGCTLQFALLMMGVKAPETCRANIVK
jgi:hypothetical protein